MTPEEELIALCAGDIEPTLSPDELAGCLDKAAIFDEDGKYSDDPHWEPTYDLHRAAAAAWRIKAAKVAADYSVTIEGREVNRGQMVDNFLRMASEHAKLAQPRFMGADGDTEPWRC